MRVDTKILVSSIFNLLGHPRRAGPAAPCPRPLFFLSERIEARLGPGAGRCWRGEADPESARPLCRGSPGRPVAEQCIASRHTQQSLLPGFCGAVDGVVFSQRSARRRCIDKLQGSS